MLEITGYSSKISTRPGDTLEIKVSCEAGAREFKAELIRIICGDDSPSGPGYKVENIPHPACKPYPGRKQPIRSGSSVALPENKKLENLGSFTLQALVFPTTPGRGVQGILGTTGMRLVLDGKGAVALELGADVISTGKPLRGKAWHLVAASYDAAKGKVHIYQEPLVPLSKDEIVVHRAETTAKSSLRATGFRIADGKFNGKIDSPRIAARVLTRQEMAAAPVTEYIGAWDFSLDISSLKVTDISGNDWHGTCVNLPARAVTGHRWDGTAASWRENAAHYGAIHFHEDDLYDANWATDFELKLPEKLKSGIYALRLSCIPSVPERTEEAEAFIVFFVAPPKGTVNAPVAFLASTATYVAYANSHHGWRDPLAEICFGMAVELGPTDQFLQQRPDYGLSTYDMHVDGSGVCFSSRLRPILNMRPKHAAWNFGADTHITAWLEAAGQGYDVITDEHLHAEGTALLSRYSCVITGTHPEYYTPEMLKGIEGFLAKGGRLMYLGGNGFYWHTAYHPECPAAVEVRRAANGSRTWAAKPGEWHMASTGRMGGLWANCGAAPQQLVGVGYASTGFDSASYYRRLPDSFSSLAAFIFNGVGIDEKIGDFGSLGGAAGYELDIVDPSLGTPANSLRLAASEGHGQAYVMSPEALLCNYPGADGPSDPRVRADMVFFETPAGGAVFSTGSITWAASLAHDKGNNNVARITGNVLKRFIDPKKF